MAYKVEIARLPVETLFDLKGPFEPLRLALAPLRPAWPERPNSARRSGNLTLYWLGHDHWLLRAPVAEETRLKACLAEAANAAYSITLISDVYAGFAVSGPDSIDVLAQASPLDFGDEAFPLGSATFTECFGQTALVARESECYCLFIERSYADYAAAALGSAAGMAVGKANDA